MKQLFVNARELAGDIGHGLLTLCGVILAWGVVIGLLLLAWIAVESMTLTGAVLILALVVLCSGGRR